MAKLTRPPAGQIEQRCLADPGAPLDNQDATVHQQRLNARELPLPLQQHHIITLALAVAVATPPAAETGFP